MSAGADTALVAHQENIAASLSRRLGNALAADGDPDQAQVWDDALIEAVDAARSYGTPLASIVAGLMREAAARGWV